MSAALTQISGSTFYVSIAEVTLNELYKDYVRSLVKSTQTFLQVDPGALSSPSATYVSMNANGAVTPAAMASTAVQSVAVQAEVLTNALSIVKSLIDQLAASPLTASQNERLQALLGAALLHFFSSETPTGDANVAAKVAARVATEAEIASFAAALETLPASFDETIEGKGIASLNSLLDDLIIIKTKMPREARAVLATLLSQGILKLDILSRTNASGGVVGSPLVNVGAAAGAGAGAANAKAKG